MTEPYSGAPVIERGSKIVLVVSQGPYPAPPANYVQVPSLRGRAQGDALAALQDSGLRARVFNEHNPTIQKGRVTSQVPRESASAAAGSEVVLVVSSGPPEVPQGVVALPDVIGLPVADATASLQSAGLRPEIVEQYSQAVPAGTVVDQLPNSADLIARPPKKKTNAWVWIAVLAILAVLVVGAVLLLQQPSSPEAELVRVPDVIGLSEQTATELLEGEGLRVNPRTEEDESVDPDTVTEQTPAAGSEVEPGSRVDITVAIAPPVEEPAQVKVPNVVGQSKADAEAELRDAGLKAATVENPSDTVEKGLVIMQLPTADTLVAPGANVSVLVSSGPPESAATITVPDVVGKTTEDAEAALRAAGLEVQSLAVAGTSEQVGYVFEQAPAKGEAVPEGSTVTVLYAE